MRKVGERESSRGGHMATFTYTSPAD